MYSHTCTSKQPQTALPHYHNHKNALQGDDAEFDRQLKPLAKKMQLIGLHMTGNQNAKKRFEAMLA